MREYFFIFPSKYYAILTAVRVHKRVDRLMINLQSDFQLKPIIGSILD
ncbi:hypothetical protein NTGHW29_60001 [Candidatus Nitrotoga sp. HW29]|nr:hypothetical protein NTGHW29_60001 [Candidatus Nitrotoga sp. HW29]